MMLFVDRIGSWKINMKKSAVTYPKISIFLFYTCNFFCKQKMGQIQNPDDQQHRKRYSQQREIENRTRNCPQKIGLKFKRPYYSYC